MSMALGVVGGLTSLAGTIGGMLSAGSAARAQEDAAAAAQGYIKQTANNANNYLNPYMSLGTAGANLLTSQLPSLSQGFDPTMAQLEQTPGYQFALQQGQEATQNGYAARGLGVSGAALKGAANYASGLADQTYTNQANIYNQNRQITGNLLTGVSGMGQQAATQAGNNLMATIGPYTGEQNAIGNAQAQGIMAPWVGLTSLGNSMMGQSASGTGVGSLGSMASIASML
ncbi:MAG: hypothetical protein KGH91_03030 [Rhodospirillales bacterium]|nr:hypothetical protein [Rhodospirillales bacterium]